MTSSLSGIPIESRRRLAATLGLFAALCLTVGVVANTGRAPTLIRVVSAVILVVAVLLGLGAWSVLRSVKVDLAEMRLDRAIDDAIASGGGSALSCGCGHDHDADELHVSGTAVDHPSCVHGDSDRCPDMGNEGACGACALATMRPAPDRHSSERLPG